MNTISVKDHINVDHRAYAQYDNERSIASLVDGLKTSSRKILHTVIETVKDGTEIKVSNLGSRTSDFTHYQHGEDNLFDAVVVMARDYTGSNNVPLLKREGQFGTRQDNKASEPRYIYVKRHSNIDKLFHNIDSNILPFEYYDGVKVEPKYFLPVLPSILLNGSEGIGNGYSSFILPRNISDVKAATIEYLKTGVSKHIPPGFNGFTGSINKTGKQYIITGVFKRIDRTTIEITDLPPDSSFQYEKYKNRVLIPLLEKGVITSFDDNSSKNIWSIIIKAPTAFVKLKDEELITKLGLSWKVSETLNFWGYSGKLHMFNNIEELIPVWAKGRLTYMEDRRLFMIKDYKQKYQWLQDKSNFIVYWNINSKTLVSLKRSELKELIKKDINVTDEVVDKLLALRIASLTLDDISALQEEMKAILDEIKFLESTNAVEMLILDIGKIK